MGTNTRSMAAAAALTATGTARVDTTRLDRYYADLLEEGRIQGAAYLIAGAGEVIASKAIGKQTCREDSKPLGENAIGNLFEATMIFTATVIMQLIEEGKLGLHQSVGSILPAFSQPYYESITVFHLLTHTSGLRGNPGAYSEPHTLPHFEYHPTFKGDWLQTVLSGRLASKPGKLSVFSNAGYAVLGAVIEKVERQRFETCVKTRILSPLGMTDTFFDVPADRVGDIVYAFDWQTWMIDSPPDLRMPRAFGGLHASLRDMLKFGQAMLGGGKLGDARILSEQSVRLMTTNRLVGVPELFWHLGAGETRKGLGWRLHDSEREPIPSTAYSFGTGQCGIYVDPDEQLVYAYFVPNGSWDFEAVNTKPVTLLNYGLGRGQARPAERASASRMSKAADKLETYLSAAVDAGTLQGAAYAIADAREVHEARAIGRRVYNDSQGQLRPDSIFMLSSLTKLLTQIAVMQLVEEGRLTLGQSVKTVIPAFDTDMHRSITVLQLLNHTSGLAPEPGMDGEPNPNGWWEYRFLFEQGEGDDSSSAWLKAVLAGPPASVPGERTLYSTAGYAVLGEIVARVSGSSYEDYVRSNILEPLGMAETFFEVPVARRQDVCLADEWQENLMLLPPGAREGEPPRSGAGIYSTMQDLLRLGQMLLRGGTAASGRQIVGQRLVELLERHDYMGLPGLSWSGASRERFPFGPGPYPLKQLSFPMPLYHDAALTGALVLDQAAGVVAVVMSPASVDWSPQPLAAAHAILSANL